MTVLDPRAEDPAIAMNPSYGEGTFRRAIRLTTSGRSVRGALEDENHAMRCVLAHDGQAVTGVEAEMIRVPTTLCGGASAAIKSIIGTPLDTPYRSFFEGGRARHQCTHLYDLVTLAFGHVGREETEREYRLAVSDEDGGESVATATLQGEPVHRWVMQSGIVRDPPELAGRSILKGFLPVISELFAGDRLEAAIALQKGVFVAQARRFDFAAGGDRPISVNRPLIGQCFAYQPERAAQGRFVRSVRDFTDRPEDLLRFRDA